MRAEAAAEAARAAPPVTVSAAYFAGYSINELVAAATLLYVVLQIILLIPRYVREYRAWRAGREVRDE